jgi:hypothetical protein
MIIDQPFNLTIFTNSTKKTCMCSSIAIFIIVLFIITPLKYLLKISLIMKLVALMLMIYTIYVNNDQINLLRNVSKGVNSEQMNNQLNINILCSYVFTAFIGLLCLFVIKSFF